MLFIASGAALAGASERPPFPTGASAYLIEVQGRPVASHAADRQLPPASLTKIMTALLILEKDMPLQDVVVVSPRVQAASGTRLRLHAGDEMSVGDLLAAALLLSANDACLALAERMSGSEGAFVGAMNARAQELGLRHTHFTNACGHDEPRHYSSAHDLARLADEAMRQPIFAALVKTVRYDVSTRRGRSWNLVNANPLVSRYPGAVGIKTGFTPRAGKCVIARARRNGVDVLLVVLGASNRWTETVDALDDAFSHAS